MATVLGLSGEDIKTIGAAATTAGVLIALFGPSWRRWWRSPLLSVGYEPVEGDPHWDHVAIAGEAFFVRVRVSNARGCDAAKDVEVIVAGFRAGEIGLDERALEWSGQRPRHRDPVTKLDIAPGLSRHVDVLQVTPGLAAASARPDDGTNAGAEARLCVFPKPWGKSHIIERGDLPRRMTLVIAAANADALSYDAAVLYDGARALLSPAPLLADAPLRHRVRQRLRRADGRPL